MLHDQSSGVQQPFVQRRVAVKQYDPVLQPVLDPGFRLVQQFVAILEVQVRDTATYACLAGSLRHRQRLDPFLGNKINGGPQQAFPCLLRIPDAFFFAGLFCHSVQHVLVKGNRQLLYSIVLLNPAMHSRGQRAV